MTRAPAAKGPREEGNPARARAAREGSRSRPHSGVPGVGLTERDSHLSVPQRPWAGDVFISVLVLGFFSSSSPPLPGLSSPSTGRQGAVFALSC